MSASKPHTTLFLIQSLDGKITTGNNNERNIDKDLRVIPGVKEGLAQYYELEKKLDRVYLNSGRVFEKVGFNDKVWEKDRSDNLSFVVVDSEPHLTIRGCEYLAQRCDQFFLITKNPNHPAISLTKKFTNIIPIVYDRRIDFTDAFKKLRSDYGIQRMTVQTGGTLNAKFLRLGLIDEISIVIAPCLIGGENTPSLIGGKSLHSLEDLKDLKALKLIKSETWESSYIHLQYEVIN